MVSITYGHGFLFDCDVTTDWAETGATAANGAFSVLHGDYYDLENTGGAVDYSVVNGTNIGISTTTYPTIMWRYKTSDTSVKAEIIVEFSDTNTQTVLAETSSTTLTVGSTTLTAAKTLDHISLYANGAVGHVYYDFVFVYQGAFTFPNVGFDLSATIPNRNVFLPVPMRQTDVTQQLGSGNMEYRLGCDMTVGTWTRTADVVNGQVFYDIAGEAPSEPFQWFDSEREQMKVTLAPPQRVQAGSNTTLIDRMDLTLNEYRLSDGDNSLETYITRWGLNL